MVFARRARGSPAIVGSGCDASGEIAEQVEDGADSTTTQGHPTAIRWRQQGAGDVVDDRRPAWVTLAIIPGSVAKA